MPNFGEFSQKQMEIKQEYYKSKIEENINFDSNKNVNVIESSKVAKIKDVIGSALDKIGTYGDLNNKEQVVALIDEEMCINCGKCYMACNDSGYQAIQFDPLTHLPSITNDCTGCAICLSVCPIIDCITMVDRKGPYNPYRGIDDENSARVKITVSQ